MSDQTPKEASFEERKRYDVLDAEVLCFPWRTAGVQVCVCVCVVSFVCFFLCFQHVVCMLWLGPVSDTVRSVAVEQAVAPELHLPRCQEVSPAPKQPRPPRVDVNKRLSQSREQQDVGGSFTFRSQPFGSLATLSFQYHSSPVLYARAEEGPSYVPTLSRSIGSLSSLSTSDGILQLLEAEERAEKADLKRKRNLTSGSTPSAAAVAEVEAVAVGTTRPARPREGQAARNEKAALASSRGHRPTSFPVASIGSKSSLRSGASGVTLSGQATHPPTQDKGVLVLSHRDFTSRSVVVAAEEAKRKKNKQASKGHLQSTHTRSLSTPPPVLKSKSFPDRLTLDDVKALDSTDQLDQLSSRAKYPQAKGFIEFISSSPVNLPAASCSSETPCALSRSSYDLIPCASTVSSDSLPMQLPLSTSEDTTKQGKPKTKKRSGSSNTAELSWLE